MRPTRITNPGAVPRYNLGSPADGGEGQQPPIDCCEVDESTIPDRADGRPPFSLTTQGVPGIVQSEEDESGNSSPTTEVTLAASPTPGNVLLAALVMRGIDTYASGWPSGWTSLGTVDMDSASISAGTLEMRYRVVQPGDSDTLTITKGGSHYAYLVLTEIGGVDVPGTPVLRDNQTSSPATMSVPITVAADDTLVLAEFIVAGIDEVVTPGAGWTTLETGQAGVGPTGLVEYQQLDTGSHNATASSGTGISNWAAIVVPFPLGGEPVWAVLEPSVTDGDDSTYEDVTGPDFLRFDLGSAYRIVRTRMRLGTTTAGAKTLTLTAWNELDESDATVVTTIDFTGVGSLTAQEVTSTFLNETAYRYWQVSGPSEVIRWFEVEFYEPTLGQSHSHSADLIDYDNTDSGLTADNVQDAIDELLDEITSGAIWRPVMAQDPADTDHWYVVVDGDGTAVMAQ